MKNYTTLTPTELLKLINDTKFDHENIKNEILNSIKIVEENENLINIKLEDLKLLEDKYVLLIEEFNKRT
jgi:hypothetical protein